MTEKIELEKYEITIAKQKIREIAKNTKQETIKVLKDYFNPLGNVKKLVGMIKEDLRKVVKSSD